MEDEVNTENSKLTPALEALAKKRKKQPSTQLQSPSLLLPDDILLEILQRLPVNSLLRFTIVSKSWRASIKNPSFISSYHHHHHHEDSHLVFMPFPVFTPYPPYPSVQIRSLRPETSTIPNYNPVLKLSYWTSVVGSCEGLICLETTSNLYVWNPFIRKSLKKVPAGEIPVNTTSVNRGKLLSLVLGFGFAPKSRDHRVVKVLCKDNYLSEVEIYSLASDSWRRIKAPPSRFTYTDENSKMISFSTSPVYLDGSIYWLASKNDLILRFDLEEEKFEEIAIPSLKYHPNYYKLVVIKGFLVIWRVWIEFGGAWNNIEINVEAYINGKSNSGSSSWMDKTIRVSRHDGEIIRRRDTTMGGHIIVTVSQGQHRRVLAYDGCCDGKNLSFEGKDIKIIDQKSLYYCIVPRKPFSCWIRNR